MRNMYVPMLEINIRRTIGLDLARFWIALSTTMFIKGRIARSRPTKYGRQLLASKRIVEIMRYNTSTTCTNLQTPLCALRKRNY